MTTEQIQFQLLAYAKKEKRYTIIGMVFYAIAIVGIAWLMFGTKAGAVTIAKFFPNTEKIGFLKYLPLICAISILFFAVYKVVQLVKTESKINAFIAEINKQNTIISLDAITNYKLYIPLGKIKINLLPIQYAFITLKDKKKYYLPMPGQCIQPLKSINHGVSQNVESTWNQIQ